MPVAPADPFRAFDYPRWAAAARRLVGPRPDAPDVLHDAMLAALTAGRTDFADPATSRWFAGVLRNTARMAARSATRRRRHESASPPRRAPAPKSPPDPTPLARLSPALRSTATLLLAGLTRDEIRHIQAIPDTALRRRLADLRKALPDPPDPIPSADAHLDLGPIRRALLAWLAVLPTPAAGIADPDGHLLVFTTPIKKIAKSPSQPAPGRQQSPRRTQS